MRRLCESEEPGILLQLLPFPWLERAELVARHLHHHLELFIGQVCATAELVINAVQSRAAQAAQCVSPHPRPLHPWPA